MGDKIQEEKEDRNCEGLRDIPSHLCEGIHGSSEEPELKKLQERILGVMGRD